MSREGWVKLWRKTQDSDMYRALNSKQRDLMMNILMRANYEEKTWEWKGELQKCEQGQFKTSLNSLKELCAEDVSIQNIRTGLEKLEKWDFITNESTKSGRIITVLNWDEYQGNGETTNKENNKEVTKNQQRGNKEVTTNKKYKELKEGKELTTKISEVIDFYSKHAGDTKHLVDHEKPTLQDGRKYIRNRLQDGFEVQQCKDAILGAIEANKSDKSWWTSQRDIEGIFKTKSGKYIEKFSKWHNGDEVNSGLLKNNNDKKTKASDEDWQNKDRGFDEW